MEDSCTASRHIEGAWLFILEINSHLIVRSQIFKDATLFFSCSTPSLATVIPAMNHIDETLTSHSLDLKFEPSIRAALGIAKKTLNQYYNATDQSEVYCITMGMSCIVVFGDVHL